jgi:hypothetical protein
MEYLQNAINFGASLVELKFERYFELLALRKTMLPFRLLSQQAVQIRHTLCPVDACEEYVSTMECLHL